MDAVIRDVAARLSFEVMVAEAAFVGVVVLVAALFAYVLSVYRKARIIEEKANPWATKAKGKLDELEEQIALLFDGTGTHLTASELTSVWAALLFLPGLTTLAIGQPWWLAALASAAGGLAPFLWVRVARKRARMRFEETLGQALPLVASNLRGGLPFRSAIVPVGENMAEPLKGEFALLGAELDQGTPVEEALAHMAGRNNSKDIMLLASAVMAQRDTGGNLADVVDSVAQAIQTRVELRRMVRSKTSQARMSARILCALPVIMVVVMCVMQESFRSFYLSELGLITMLGMLVLIAVGYLIMRKMADLKAD